MNTNKLSFLFLGFLFCNLVNSCKTNTSDNPESSEKAKLQAQYEFIPREEILNDTSVLAKSLYQEMSKKYVSFLTELNGLVTANGAKMVLVNVTPEVGNSLTQSQKIGSEFISSICKSNNIDYVDFAPVVSKYTPTDITMMPKDGHWSEKGAEIIADEFEKIILANASQISSKKFENSARPKIMGDLKPSNDELLDGGKGLPYRLKTNSQGLRMNHEVLFPKTKQRILVMGDSELFFPFMENDKIATEVLQKKMTDKDILNISNWGYSIEDFVSLYKEKGQFLEPDLILVGTNGNEIFDMYFSHRNRFSRTSEAHNPDSLELAFYNKTFKK